jgi:TolA-binding protein
MKKPVLLFLIFLLPISLYGFTQERELYSQAQSRYLNNNYKAALETFDELVRQFPLSDLVPDAQYWKAVCLYRLARYDESIKRFEVIERRYRATRFFDYVHFWKGVAYYRKGEEERAIESLAIFLSIQRVGEFKQEALLYKAMAEVHVRRFNDGKKTMEQLMGMKEEPSPFEIVLNSFILLNLASYDELVRFQNEIDIETLPTEWKQMLILYRAEGYLQLENIDEAERNYLLLLDSGADISAIALRRLYAIAAERRDFTRLEWVVQRAEEKLTGYPGILQDFWMRMGIESYKRYEYDLAEYFLTKVWNLRAAEQVPEAIPLYLSQIYLKRGQRRDAQRVLQDYLSRSGVGGTQVLTLYSLGNIQLGDGDFRAAAESYSRALELEPQSTVAQNTRFLLAYSEFRQDLLVEALYRCDEFLELLVETVKRGEATTPSQLDIELRDSVVRLKSRILTLLYKSEEAIAVLREHTGEFSGLVKAHLDLMKILFSNGNHEEVIEEAAQLFGENPGLETDDPNTYMLIQYIQGLSRLSLKQYEEADRALSLIDPAAADAAGLSDIVPFVAYYRAWTQYRMDNLEKALAFTEDFLTLYPEHGLKPGALYLDGWINYSMGNYMKSEELFAILAGENKDPLSMKAHYLQGKSLRNLKKSDAESSFADDALFEYADILKEKGNHKDAALVYFNVWDTYPGSILAEQSLYKRAETYFSAEMYRMAKNAFRDYRVQYPEGGLVDASLYWEGVASHKLEEDRSAVNLWEGIIDKHRKSAFRPDAMRGTAEAYVNFGEYPRALDMYNTLIEEHPDYADGINAALRREEIRYLVFGFGKREAELTARISEEGGARTAEGRAAMIELARLYIYEEERKIERAFQILSQVKQQEDTETTAEAGVLLGEYYYKQGEMEKAGREFFLASLQNPDDEDLMAYAIYRAAHSMNKAGKSSEVRELVQRLQDNFPSSSWSDEGQKLLEELDD